MDGILASDCLRKRAFIYEIIKQTLQFPTVTAALMICKLYYDLDTNTAAAQKQSWK